MLEDNNQEKDLEFVAMTLEQSFHADSRHLRQMLMGNFFSGTPEEREALIKKISDLESKFCQATIDTVRQKHELDKGKVMPEWNRQYGFVKLQVYKACGYTKPNNPYQDLW
jgi:hypothetical protein